VETILCYTPGACSLASIVALEWLGDPYQLCRVDPEARSSDAYRAINPRSEVPALRVDRRTLLESNAILAHIADRRPDGRLLPTNGTWERDLANERLARIASGFHPAFWPYSHPERYTTDPSHEGSVKAAAERSIRRELAALDRDLDGRDWILGDHVSVLDAYVHAMDRWANPIVSMPSEFPNVWRHQKALARDRAVRLGLEIERNVDANLSQSSCLGHITLAQLSASSVA
jgi:glutathione S-transferase